MYAFIKFLIMLATLFLLCYPLFPFKAKIKNVFTLRSLAYEYPHNKKNVIFLVLSAIWFIFIAILFSSIQDLANLILQIPFVGRMLASVSNKTVFVEFVVLAILGNLIILYGFSIIKALIVKLFSPSDKNKKDGGIQQDPIPKDKEEEGEDEENEKKNKRVAFFEHTKDELQKEEERLSVRIKPFTGLFFEEPQYLYAKTWVIRVRTILQTFIYFVEALYVALFVMFMLCVFFPVNDRFYDFLNGVLHVQDWYIYPFISIIVLQEVCNIFKALPKEMEKGDKEEKKEQPEEITESEAKLIQLQNAIKKRFDKDHFLRYYPTAERNKVVPYKWTNVPYSSALSYIKAYMIMKRKSEDVEAVMDKKEIDDDEYAVQSYLEALDSSFNGNHIYICSSFFAEFGEYLIAYTYTRLLSGSRVVYIVPDTKIIPALRKYISDRLLEMTGCTAGCNWRVYTADERVDQADVLIASPDDFKDDNIVEHFPSFFKSVCNAIFIDSDKTVTLHNYLCTVIASRLLKVTNGEIKFIFLTDTVLKGFAGEILPKYFCVENVLTYSSAEENEQVSYTLWNRESKSNRVYNKHGQTLTGLECIIAELAYNCGIDGIRIISNHPFDHADYLSLIEHDVEINALYKNVPEINYMIYADDRYNLAAALYTCTRFRGRKHSVVNIISKPYLLREYFNGKSVTDDYINRSSFIQPHVTEHADTQKLSFVKLLCDATSESGITISDFNSRIDDIVKMSRERGETPLTEYCAFLESKPKSEWKTVQYAAYLVSALYDYKDTPKEESIAKKAKDYYLITNPIATSSYELTREKTISFKRVSDIFSRLFECRDRISLKLNDNIIGEIDTFPTRVSLQYVEGQSIVFNNCEYEIEQIASDNKSIYLRRENVTFKNTLDTIFLRRYKVELGDKIMDDGIFHNSKTNLAEIRVSKRKAHIVGETYGFYSLLTDNQTLDFKRGVVGNPHFDDEVIEKNKRDLTEGRLLYITLVSRNGCNDKMRLLLSAVFNEFIKTLFPDAYRCVAVCPILDEPFNVDGEDPTFEQQVCSLYPMLKDSDEKSKSNEMQFYIINDCVEDVGVIDAFYDRMAHNVEEFLVNVYSYLNWLKQRPNLNHYIYFGDTELPKCFDLEGCCDLLSGLNVVFSDNGEYEYETANELEEENKIERCAFCHRILESGRYKRFDTYRYICADCFETVESDEELSKKLEEMLKYLQETYPLITFPTNIACQFTKVFSLEKGQVLSEYYYNLDPSRKIICIEKDSPIVNIEVSLLRGIIEQWQIENEYILNESKAQLYFEELKYLRSKGLNESADYIYELLDDSLKTYLDEFIDYTGECIYETGATPVENPEGEETVKKTSFDLITEIANQEGEYFNQEEYDENSSDDLYDPNSVPRFWKRYLMGQNISMGEDELSSENTVEDNGDNAMPNRADKLIDNVPEDGFEDFGNMSDNEDTDGENDNNEDVKIENQVYEENLPVEEEKSVEDEPEKEVKVKEKKTTTKNKKEKSSDESVSKKAKKFAPVEEEEERNPLIKFYMSIVRHAYDYATSNISTYNLSDEEIQRVFRYVQYDYPELFYLNSIEWGYGEARLIYRCLTPDGRLDIRQIERKKREIKVAAKEFTRGITKKTRPYDALLTIYRRLILKLDYDTIGLTKGAGNNMHEDDTLRSLYSAIVTHKVVCAGYAVALQYLAQSVGITCGYVTSEPAPDGMTHAFNMLKIGRYCYYVDATWGDWSNTSTGNKYKDRIVYAYCCVPYNEFILADKNRVCFHIPNKRIFPTVEQLNCTNHEYYRYHEAYLTGYDFDALVDLVATQATDYDDREMGDFVISFRASNNALANYLVDRINRSGTLGEILQAASIKVAKNKKALSLLRREYYQAYTDITNVVYIEPVAK